MAQRQPVSPLASPSTPIEPPRLLDMSANVPHQSGRDFMGIPPAEPPVPRRALANQYEDAVAAVQRENPQQPSQAQRQRSVLVEAQGYMDNINTRATLAEAPAPPGMGGDMMQPPTPPKQESFVAWSRRNYPQHVGRRVKNTLIQSAHKQYIAEQGAKISMFNAEVAAFNAKLASAKHIAMGEPKPYSAQTLEESYRMGGMPVRAEAQRERRLSGEERVEKAKRVPRNRTLADMLVRKAEAGALTTEDVVRFTAMSKARSPQTRTDKIKGLTTAYTFAFREASYGDDPGNDPVVKALAGEITKLITQGDLGASGADPQMIQGIVNMMGSGGISRAAGAKLFELLKISPEDIVSGNANAASSNPFNQRFPQ